MTSKKRVYACHYQDLGSAFDWSWMPRGKLALTNQRYYLDLGSDASSVWNFCARFSDVISLGNQWWRREMSALFSGYFFLILVYFTLLNSPRRLNTATGDEPGLASQLISTHHYPPNQWKVLPHQRGLRPFIFKNSSVGSFTSHNNHNRERAVRRGLRFFVPIRED